MRLQVGVKILIQNKRGKYLLLHRNTEKYKGVKGEWDIVGGRIKLGTPLLENLQREVQEETGLTLVGKPQLIAAQDILLEEKHVVRLTYVGSTAEGEVVLNIEENDEYQWYTKEEMEQEENLDVYLKELLQKNITPHFSTFSGV